MNNIIANIRTQLRKLKCRIANLTKRVAYIEDNCCNGGGDGIQSIVPGDNISVDNADPQNPVVSSTGTIPEFVQITEGNNTGWGLKYRADNPDNYGDIGSYAIDLSISFSSSSTRGATGYSSIVSGGYSNTASGFSSIVSGGSSNTASGTNSTISGGTGNVTSETNSTISGGTSNTASGSVSTVSGGQNNTANSYGEWVGGLFGTIPTGQNATSFVATNRLFNVGNGTTANARSNAFTILKNGLATLPSVTNALIDAEPTGKAVVTKEWVEDYVDDNFLPLPTEGTTGQVLTTDGDGVYTWEDSLDGDNYVSVLDISSTPTADKVVKYTSTGAVNTVAPTLPENTVNLAYLNSAMDSKVDVVADMGLSKENFTTEEKSKLAGLESPKFKGQYLSLTDLQNAGNGEIGGYAYVDNGVTIDMYIWDNINEVWDIVVGESTTETPASIKSKYESNPDTNAFTDALKNKLEAFTSNFTAELKNTYDTTSNIVTTHQATIGKVWTPDYSNMETTNRITTSGGTWTVPAGYKGWVNLFSRGYNGSSTYNMDVFIINGKPLGKIWVEATSGSGAARSGSLNGFYPVKEGDVIQVYGNLERSCYFIPGIWV